MARGRAAPSDTPRFWAVQLISRRCRRRYGRARGGDGSFQNTVPAALRVGASVDQPDIATAISGAVRITSSFLLSPSSSGTKPLPPHDGHCCSSSVPFCMTPSPSHSGQVFTRVPPHVSGTSPVFSPERLLRFAFLTANNFVIAAYGDLLAAARATQRGSADTWSSKPGRAV